MSQSVVHLFEIIKIQKQKRRFSAAQAQRLFDSFKNSAIIEQACQRIRLRLKLHVSEFLLTRAFLQINSRHIRPRQQDHLCTAVIIAVSQLFSGIASDRIRAISE